jgi:hypothetical protein
MIAWGLYNGQFSPTSLASKAASAGYEWLALELDDFETGLFNRHIWPSVRDQCHAHNLIPGVWFTEGGNIRHTPADAEFSIAELEGPGDYDGIVSAINDLALPDCSLAVCTNFNIPLTDPQGVPQPDKAKILIDAGFTCLTECYLGDNPNATPDRLDWTAWRLGWPASQGVAGVYNSPISAYDEWKDWPLADYLGEYVL